MKEIDMLKDTGEKILRYAFSSGDIGVRKMKEICKNDNVSYQKVFNLVEPYLEKLYPDDIPGLDVIYKLSKDGQLFAAKGFWSVEKEKTANIGEIVLYQPDNSIRLEVKLENETVWLNRQQMATLFDRDIKTIGKHVNNALTEELQEFSVVAKFATTAADGKVYQMEYYNLDMILSVGYRVK
jgi:hypothetical protein